MRAQEVLEIARSAGVRLGVDGDALIVEAAAEPSLDLLAILTANKPALMALLRPGCDG